MLSKKSSIFLNFFKSCPGLLSYPIAFLFCVFIMFLWRLIVSIAFRKLLILLAVLLRPCSLTLYKILNSREKFSTSGKIVTLGDNSLRKKNSQKNSQFQRKFPTLEKILISRAKFSIQGEILNCNKKLPALTKILRSQENFQLFGEISTLGKSSQLQG